MHRSDIAAVTLAVLTALSGLYTALVAAGVPDLLDTIFPTKGKMVLLSIALVSASASALTRILAFPNTTPASPPSTPKE
jgi:hypothetical protein